MANIEEKIQELLANSVDREMSREDLQLLEARVNTLRRLSQS